MSQSKTRLRFRGIYSNLAILGEEINALVSGLRDLDSLLFKSEASLSDKVIRYESRN